MSIASEITRINTNIANSYTAVDNKNGTLPQVQNSANLASAIDSIEVIEQATAEGESLSLANTKAMPYSDYVVEGKSEQDGEPSPSNPSEIHSVADDVNLFDESQLLEATGWTKNNSVYSGIIDNWFSKFKNGFTGLSFETNTQYTISLKGYTTGGTPRIKIVYTNNTSSTLAISAGSMTEYSITSTSGKTISSVQADFGSGSAQILSLTEFKIEQGTVATPYSPYNQGTVTIKQRGTTENNDYTIQTEPLRSLPNGVKDTIEADGAHRRVGRIVLDGTETFIVEANYPRFSIALNNCTTKSGRQHIFSNYFKTALIGNDVGIGFTVNGSLFLYPETSITTLSAFKTWLSTHNTEVLYELAEETIEPLTQNQANTMLDIIKTGSYEGTTNIYTDEDVKPTMKVDYYKKA